MGIYGLVFAVFFAVVLAYAAQTEENHSIDMTEARQRASASALLVVHQAAVVYARSNPAVTGNIALPALNIANGFANVEIATNISNTGAVRTWVIPTAKSENQIVLAEATRLHQGSLNIGVTLATGGWRSMLGVNTIGGASDTVNVPVGVVMVFSQVR